jgi:two-component system, response regulator PdtaR
MRVVVAEDNTLIAMLIEDVLIDQGHEVVGSVTTARAALSLIEQQPPDLLIADITLDDGESGCDLVMEAQKRCGTPALFVSGSPDKAQRCDTAIGVLVKPFPVEALEAAIQVAEEIVNGKQPVQVPSELRLFPEFTLTASRQTLPD